MHIKSIKLSRIPRGVVGGDGSTGSQVFYLSHK